MDERPGCSTNGPSQKPRPLPSGTGEDGNLFGAVFWYRQVNVPLPAEEVPEETQRQDAPAEQAEAGADQ